MPLSTVEMTTQPSSGDFSIHRFDNPDVYLSHHLTVNVITEMALDGVGIVNPDHSAYREFLEPEGEPIKEWVTLSDKKARRLLQFYESLTPQHPYQCHDLVTAVEGWKEDKALNGTFKIVQPTEQASEPEDLIVPSDIYNVHVVASTSIAKEYLRTHSCIGTDNNRLLALLGKGHVLATMTPTDAIEFYREGAFQSFLSRALSFKRGWLLG